MNPFAFQDDDAHPKSVPLLKETGLPQSGKNIWRKKFFSGQEKSQGIVDGQGNLERTWKIREKSGNLKINGYGMHKIYLFCSRGERMYILVR